MKQACIYAITLAFIAVVCFITWAAATKQDYFFFKMLNWPLGDKVAHFCLIGTLALLFNLSLRNARVRLGPREWLIGSLIVFVVVTLEEFSQNFFDHRTFDLVDLSGNYAGIFCFGWLSKWRRQTERGIIKLTTAGNNSETS